MVSIVRIGKWLANREGRGREGEGEGEVSIVRIGKCPAKNVLRYVQILPMSVVVDITRAKGRGMLLNRLKC